MQHTPDPMRHIPEEELHAYLDQALSRSQCVEIEHHLAECLICRAERDAIAALRDRTTALLVAAAPRRIRPRPFTQLSATHVERSSRRARRLRAAAWAASVMAALGLGWGFSQWSGPELPVPEQAQGRVAPILAAPLQATLPGGSPAPRTLGQAATPVRLTASNTRPGAPTLSPASSPDTSASQPPPRPAASELASVRGTSATREPVLDGVWRTVSWANTQSERAEWVPRVEGVPVVQVKVRQAPRGGRPITLVTQQLANGEMISTVEGPSQEVATLLSQQPGQSASAELQDMQAAPSRRTLAIFGSAPSDSLKAFMLRVK